MLQWLKILFGDFKMRTKFSTKYCNNYANHLSETTGKKYVLSVGYDKVRLIDCETGEIVVSANSNAEFAGKILVKSVELMETVG